MVFEIAFDEDSYGHCLVTTKSLEEITQNVLFVMVVADEVIIDSHIETDDLCSILIRYFGCSLTASQEGCKLISTYDTWNGEKLKDGSEGQRATVERYMEDNLVTWNNRNKSN